MIGNDTIIIPSWIIPIQPLGKVLENQALVIRDGRIDAICPIAEAKAMAPEADIIERD